METTILATFARIDDMRKAVKALKKHGVIDMRLVGNPRRFVSDPVEFAAEPQAINADELAAGLSLWVFVEKSRFRQAEDTITACGGDVNIFE